MGTTKTRSNIGATNYTTKVTNEEHQIIVDEPTDIGGLNKGMRPTEYLTAALGSCTAITLKMYLDNKKVAVEDIQVEVTLIKEEGQRNKLKKVISIRPRLDEQLAPRAMRVAGKCHVHKLLKDAFDIESELV